jgi:hypothetical protein
VRGGTSESNALEMHHMEQRTSQTAFIDERSAYAPSLHCFVRLRQQHPEHLQWQLSNLYQEKALQDHTDRWISQLLSLECIHLRGAHVNQEWEICSAAARTLSPAGY